jgi:hypothetical protein
MGKFEDSCKLLGQAIDVNTLNGQLVYKLKDIKRKKNISINIMDTALIASNPALLALKTSSWVVHKIKNVFVQ